VNMFARQGLALAFAAATLVGCSANAVPGAGAVSGASESSAFHPLTLAAPNSTPSIKEVTPIQPTQYQTIVIKGKGFGKMKPYDGDSCCIEFTDINVQCSSVWSAGYLGDAVTLDVTKWSNDKIVVAGFTGAYGGNGGCSILWPGSYITLDVWNAQTRSGPATWNGTVQYDQNSVARPLGSEPR
jgi:hypothetical protein